jgi:hypothetical protein
MPVMLQRVEAAVSEVCNGVPYRVSASSSHVWGNEKVWGRKLEGEEEEEKKKNEVVE